MPSDQIKHIDVWMKKNGLHEEYKKAVMKSKGGQEEFDNLMNSFANSDKSLAGQLISSFNFSLSPQGSGFWLSIGQRLVHYQSDCKEYPFIMKDIDTYREKLAVMTKVSESDSVVEYEGGGYSAYVSVSLPGVLKVGVYRNDEPNKLRIHSGTYKTKGYASLQIIRAVEKSMGFFK